MPDELIPNAGEGHEPATPPDPGVTPDPTAAEPPAKDARGVPYYNVAQEHKRKLERAMELLEEERIKRSESERLLNERFETFLKQQTQPQPYVPPVASPAAAAFQKTIPGVQTPQLDPAALDQLIEQRLEQKLQQVEQTRREAEYREAYDDWTKRATERYPALNDEFSPLHTEVTKRARSIFADAQARGYKPDPRTVYHVAREVAEELGVKPEAPRTPGIPVPNAATQAAPAAGAAAPPPSSGKAPVASNAQAEVAKLPPDMQRMIKRQGWSPEKVADYIKKNPDLQQLITMSDRLAKGEYIIGS